MLTRRQYLLLLTPVSLLVVPFLLGPLVVALTASFTDYGPAQSGGIHFVGLTNYEAVLGDRQVDLALRNAAVWLLVGVPAELGLGFALAWWLRRPFRGRGWLRVVLLLPWLLSPVGSGVMWHFLYQSRIGLFDFALTWLGLEPLPSPLASPELALWATLLTEVWRKAPLASFLLLPGLLAVPSELWEQATLDGAPLATTVTHVALPWLRPLVLTIGLLLVADSLGTFEQVLMLTGGGPGGQTMLPGLYSYREAFRSFNWSTGATSALLIAGGVLIIGLSYLAVVRQEREP
jgi:ABC-type sugar transport system permease subunit